MPGSQRRLVPDDVFRRLCRTREFMHAFSAEPLNVERLAKISGMSPFHFVREFARAFGDTPHAYLMGLRLERAKELLRQDRLPVTEICLEVGFTSLGSFSTLFSKTAGQSPTLYRREMGRVFQIPLQFEKTLIPHCFLNFFHPSP